MGSSRSPHLYDRGNTTILERLAAMASSVSRYDLVLAAIPLALALGVVLGRTSSIANVHGAASGGVAAVTAAVYALTRPPGT